MKVPDFSGAISAAAVVAAIPAIAETTALVGFFFGHHLRRVDTCRAHFSRGGHHPSREGWQDIRRQSRRRG